MSVFIITNQQIMSLQTYICLYRQQLNPRLIKPYLKNKKGSFRVVVHFESLMGSFRFFRRGLGIWYNLNW